MPLFKIAPEADHVSGRSNMTDTGVDLIIAAGGASTRIAVMSVIVTNASLTVGTKVKIQDGTTDKIIGYAAAEGGFSMSGNGHPLFVGTVNTAVNAVCVTNSSDTEVFISGYKVN